MTILKRFASVVHLSIKNGIPMQKVCVPIQISPQIIYNVMVTGSQNYLYVVA